jgi:glycosyltransferase involved in cell wall biosynthesis
MSRIVIDGRMIHWTGIGRYTIELLNQLQQIDKQNHYIVIGGRKDFERWQPNAPNFHKLQVNIPPYSFREQLVLPWLLWRQKPDLVHFTSPNLPIVYSGRHVTTIHDLTLLRYKTTRRSAAFYAIKSLAFRLTLQVAAKFSAHILTPTEFVKKDVSDYFKLQPGKITAALLGVNFAKPAKLPSKKPYLLYVGNYFPHKNIASLIWALPEVLQKTPGFRLVLAGDADSYGEALKKLAAERGVDHMIDWAGKVSDEELARLYTEATLFVYPSLSEGFGLPGLEAMAASTPVAAAAASCFPEVYGNAAAYFDPHQPADIARVINATIADKQLWETLQAAGLERVKHFSWKKTTQLTHKVYQNVLKQK